MVNRRDTLKLAAGAALGLQAAPAVASEGQETTTVAQDISGIFLAGATGGQEVPPVETEARGAAVFAVNEDGDVAYSVAVQDIENVNQAHIHLGEVGENGEVVVWLHPSPQAEEPDLIADEYDGVLATGTFGADDLTGPLEGESIEAVVQAMEDESTYVNVHTEQNPAGEVRGQIVSVTRMVDLLGFEQQETTTPPEEETTTEEETTVEEETTPEEVEETTAPEEETTEEAEETTPADEAEETTVTDEEETTTA